MYRTKSCRHQKALEPGYHRNTTVDVYRVLREQGEIPNSPRSEHAVFRAMVLGTSLLKRRYLGTIYSAQRLSAGN